MIQSPVCPSESSQFQTALKKSMPNTASQQLDIERLIPLVNRGVQDLIQSQVIAESDWGNVPAVCVDKGCGTGINATRLTDAFAKAVRRHVSVPVLNVHSDRPGCDFSRLVDRLDVNRPFRRESPHQSAAIFPVMAAGSFLDQQLPDGTAHMIVSNAALHWLEPGRQMPSATLDGESGNRDNFAMLARRQWAEFLLTTSRELMPGGRLIASFSGCQSPELRSGHVPLRLLRLAAADIIERIGYSSRDVFDFVVPIYLRSRDEVLEPFRDRSVAGLSLEVEQCCVESVACPYFSRFRQNRSAEEYAKNFTGFVRGFSEWAVTLWLKRVTAGTVSLDTIPNLLEQFYTGIERKVWEAPDRWMMQRSRIVLVATRTASG